MKREKGLALIVVLWVLTLLIIMASSFALTIQRETAIILGVKQKSEAMALTEAGVNYAIVELLNPDKTKRWSSFNSLYNVEFLGNQLRIQIADESGRISLNSADKSTLMQLFTSMAIDHTAADHLSDAILDWRDKDNELQANGAEQGEYKAAGLAYIPRNGAFESMEELQMVLGMTPEIYQQLEPVISIYSSNKQINPTTASRKVLLTLAGVTEAMVDEYLAQRADNVRNHVPVLKPDWYQSQSSQASNVFRIITEVRMDDNSTQQTLAIIRLTKATNGLPYEILKWDEDSSMASLFLHGNDARVIN